MVNTHLIMKDYRVIPSNRKGAKTLNGTVIWNNGTYVKAIHGPIGTPKPGKV